MKKIVEWLRDYFKRTDLIEHLRKTIRRLDTEAANLREESTMLLEKSFKLAKKYEAAEKGRREIARDYAIEMKESAQNQLQMDIFQQALTNQFSEEQVTGFFNQADKLRKEHEKNSN